MFLPTIALLATSLPTTAVYEVTTHQLIARFAANRSVNLDAFLQDMGLEDVTYSRTFPDAAQSAFRAVAVNDTKARQLVETGAVLEDDEGRFFHHFLDPLTDAGLDLPAFSPEPNARDWGFDGAGEANDRSWTSALNDHFVGAVTAADPEVRRDEQELLFVSLGHVIHLVQDCLQPSHTRNDAHPIVTALETYGGASVAPGSLATSVETAIVSAAPVYFPTFEEYFDTASTHSNERFFSDDTIFEDYPEPSAATTGTRAETVSGRALEFVTSNLESDPLTGDDLRLARVVRGPLAPLLGPSHTLASPGDLVVEDNSQALIPLAVVRSEGLLNHFFRGRLSLSLDPGSQALVIRNVSDVTVLGNDSNGTFVGGTYRLFYEAVDGTRHELPTALSPVPISTNLAPKQELVVPGDVLGFLEEQSDPGLDASVRAREDRRVIALYEGTIGSEAGVAAGRASFSNGVSLLLSFDVSGSIQSNQLTAAKAAGLALLPILAAGTENRAALHAFANNEAELVAFTADLAQVESGIGALTTGGLTALNDAVGLAGDAASLEALTTPASGGARRTVVVLFTDGENNNSSLSPAAAAAAISAVDRPEIDEVFLVFVGGASSGEQKLSDLGALANRPVFCIESFDQLEALFLALIQGPDA